VLVGMGWGLDLDVPPPFLWPGVVIEWCRVGRNVTTHAEFLAVDFVVLVLVWSRIAFFVLGVLVGVLDRVADDIAAHCFWQVA